jgi:peroxiredoxin
MSPFPRTSLAALIAVGLLASAFAVQADDPKPAPAPQKPAEAPKEAPKEEPKPEVAPEPVKAPDFKLKDLDGKERTLAEFAGKWVVIEWTNYECPFVKKHYTTVPGATPEAAATPGNMPSLQAKYTAQGVIWLSICSSGLKKDGTPKEGYMEPDAWKKAVAERMAKPTAVLLDRDGAVGKAYGAKTTPTVFIVDPKGMIAYQGAVDDQPKARSAVPEAKSYIAEALDHGLKGLPLPIAEVKAYG